ncbi:MAG: prepilin-type N-terminal cleavage/methylation domain-containing protein [Alphaproteobacteria bacterium]|jgi:prepilin-type N-terminal cleavage/methylation domain-containing protein|nr:prepilin-type N-terminal cleavage/methylation domain-containing protein [Alphaproteobacteria bacterium]
MRRNLPGFSLIEMAVVLIIIGLIGGLTMPALKVMMEWQKASTTTQNQEKILFALSSYALQHKKLPYAGDFTGKSTPGRVQGIVPFGALGIPEALAKDGYHRWFTYKVDDVFAKTPTELIRQLGGNLCYLLNQNIQLTVKGGEKEASSTKIAVALISHGPQGRGAYPNPSHPPPIGKDEELNTQSRDQVIDRPISYDPANPFSHKVVWVTAQNLLAIYGRAPCTRSTPEKTSYEAPVLPKKEDQKKTGSEEK